MIWERTRIYIPPSPAYQMQHPLPPHLCIKCVARNQFRWFFCGRCTNKLFSVLPDEAPEGFEWVCFIIQFVRKRNGHHRVKNTLTFLHCLPTLLVVYRNLWLYRERYAATRLPKPVGRVPPRTLDQNGLQENKAKHLLGNVVFIGNPIRDRNLTTRYFQKKTTKVREIPQSKIGIKSMEGKLIASVCSDRLNGKKLSSGGNET